MLQKNDLIIDNAERRILQFPNSLLNKLEAYHSNLRHTKAHTYPVSVPEKWTEIDDSIVDWNIRHNKPLRLYVHIPWCLTKCTYCFYDSNPAPPGDSEFNTYLSCLQKELELYCDRLSTEKLKAEVMYFGGGSPSCLSAIQINNLFNTIYKYVDFITDSYRITEISPGSITLDKLKAFVDGGVNRISMGVQCLNDNILQKCRRDHDSAQVVVAYDMLRSANVPEINFDILLTLPDQTLPDFVDTVSQTIEMAPSSISFLNLRIVPGSVIFMDNSFQPSWKENLLMRAIYQAMLSNDKQYVRTRPHYYVLPHEARENSTRVPYLDCREGPGFQVGIGASACSHLGNVVFSNYRYTDYRQSLQGGNLPLNKGFTLSEEDLLAMKVIRSVVDRMQVPDENSIQHQYAEQLDFLFNNKFINKNGILTDNGCLFGEEIACLFFP